MKLLLLFLFSIFTANVYSHFPIYLNVSNVITIKDAIDDETATTFLHKLNMLKNKFNTNGIILFNTSCYG